VSLVWDNSVSISSNFESHLGSSKLFLSTLFLGLSFIETLNCESNKPLMLLRIWVPATMQAEEKQQL